MALVRKPALLAAALLAVLVAGGARGAAHRDTVTITSSAKVAEDGVPTLLGGSVSSRRPGETVTLEQDDCGPIPWHPVLSVKTANRGGWRGFANPTTNSRYRVRWRKAVDKRTALLEQLDPATRKYRVIARTRLERAGAAGIYAATTGVFHVATRGTVRASLPDREARPCYTGGHSPPIRP